MSGVDPGNTNSRGGGTAPGVGGPTTNPEPTGPGGYGQNPGGYSTVTGSGGGPAYHTSTAAPAPASSGSTPGGFDPQNIMFNPADGHYYAFKRSIGANGVYGYETVDVGDGSDWNAMAALLGVPYGALQVMTEQARNDAAKVQQGQYGRIMGVGTDGTVIVTAPDGKIERVTAAQAGAMGIQPEEIYKAQVELGKTTAAGNDLHNWQAISANPDGSITVKNGFNQYQNVTPDASGNLINPADGKPFPGVAAGQVQYLVQQQAERSFNAGPVNTFGYGTPAGGIQASAPQYGYAPAAGGIPAAPAPSPLPPGVPPPAAGAGSGGGTWGATGAQTPAYPQAAPIAAPAASPAPDGAMQQAPAYPAQATGYAPAATPAAPALAATTAQPYQYTAPTYSAAGGAPSSTPPTATSGYGGGTTSDTAAAATATTPGARPAGTAATTTGTGTTPGGPNLSGGGMTWQQYQQQLQMLQAFNNTRTAAYQAANAGAIEGQQTVSRNQYLNQAATNSLDRNQTGRGFSGLGTQTISGAQ